jgi:hypothetical protein
VNAAAELDAMLADLAERMQAIRDFQCQHGYERTRRATWLGGSAGAH